LSRRYSPCIERARSNSVLCMHVDDGLTSWTGVHEARQHDPRAASSRARQHAEHFLWQNTTNALLFGTENEKFPQGAVEKTTIKTRLWAFIFKPVTASSGQRASASLKFSNAATSALSPASHPQQNTMYTSPSKQPIDQARKQQATNQPSKQATKQATKHANNKQGNQPTNQQTNKPTKRQATYQQKHQSHHESQSTINNKIKFISKQGTKCASFLNKITTTGAKWVVPPKSSLAM
jgi:hypothetical protein